ncbi:MAG: DegV family protein [Chitinophagaceae bacterium]|nr:DegV family protein [Anaerolineae bacterium]
MTFKKIKFATDSVCDIPTEQAQKWDITIVPCFVNYGGRSYADDGVELVREDYYNQLTAMKETPTTAAMPPEVARLALEQAYDGADHLIVITTPAKLSGIYNSMRLGLQAFPADRVTLIDSGQLSMGIGWQVLAGAEVAAETGDVQQTVNSIYRVQKHQSVYASLATLEFLRRSGRVSWAAANIGALLQIKPVVHVLEGDVSAKARVRTFGRALEALAALVREQGEIDKLALLHVNNPAALETLRGMLRDVLPQDTITGMIGPTLGTHIGPGAIGAAILKKGWRN